MPSMVFSSFGKTAPTSSRFTQYAIPGDTFSVSTDGYAAFLERYIPLPGAPLGLSILVACWTYAVPAVHFNTTGTVIYLVGYGGADITDSDSGAILGGVLSLIYWIAQTPTVLQVVLALAVVIAIARRTVWALPMIKDGQFSMTVANTRTLIFILLSLILVLALVYASYPTDNGEEKHISWDEYKRLCIRPQWDSINTARAQVLCAHLKDTPVTWSGKVKKVEEALSQLMPDSVASWVCCAYGVKYESRMELPEEMQDICNIKGSGYCHLNDQDEYTFELWVTKKISDHETQDLFSTLVMSLRKHCWNLMLDKK